MNATIQNKTIKTVKTVKKVDNTQDVEALKLQLENLKLALSKTQSALKKKTSKSLRSENTKTANNYHFSMSEFKDNVFKNKEHFKDFIISDDDNELLVKTEFKEFFMSRIREALNDLDKKEFK